MANILETLEERLEQYWLEQETKKTWEEWLQWLVELDCPLSFEKPLGLPERAFSFQTWLTACEPQLREHPDWQSRFSTPAWLRRQQVTILPGLFKSGGKPPTPVAEISALQTELARLIDQIHTVQQRMGHLEAGAAPATQPATQSFAPQIPTRVTPSGARSTSGLSNVLGRPDLARTLERELQMGSKEIQIGASPNPQSEPETAETEIVPLKEAYLSFNRWCDQFTEVHLDLQEFVDDVLRVPSSHQISFRQFSHRILRKAKDQQQLEQVLESFTRLRSNGVDVNLPKTPEASPDDTAETSEEPEQESGFVLPPDDEYQEFNGWLTRLRENGIEPNQFASQELHNAGSHKISFPQFCRRLERLLEDVNGFRAAIGKT